MFVVVPLRAFSICLQLSYSLYFYPVGQQQLNIYIYTYTLSFLISLSFKFNKNVKTFCLVNATSSLDFEFDITPGSHCKSAVTVLYS